MTLTVAMPNFNHGRYIEDALRSVLAQSAPADEIVIIDDASTDDSRDVIAGVTAGAEHVRVIENSENRGVVHTSNALLQAARGDHVLFMAADDVLLPGFFEHVRPLLAVHPEAGMCSGLSKAMDGDGVDAGVIPSPIVCREPCYLGPDRVARLLVSHGSWIMGNTTIYRRQALADIGGFRADLGAFSDGFAVQLLALLHGAAFLPRPLSSWRRVPTSYSVTSVSDPDVNRKIADRAVELMTNTYSDVFPKRYAERWARDWRVVSELTSSRSRQEGSAVRELALVLRHRPPQMLRRKIERLLHIGTGRRVVTPGD